MTPQLLEGTWDEVREQMADRTDEFRAYGKLRLLVFPEDENAPDTEEGPTLAEMLAGRAGKFHFGAADLSEDSGEKFAALLR